ncbi:MAG: hypothetical protein V1798_10740 [Pseudomonadota bacterium]
MNSALSGYLFSNASLRVLWSLSGSRGPRGVRETADLCSLSPRGASLILRRLSAAGLAVSSGRGRALRFASALDAPDRRLLETIAKSATTGTLEMQAVARSGRVAPALNWIGSTLKELQRIKGGLRGAP